MDEKDFNSIMNSLDKNDYIINLKGRLVRIAEVHYKSVDSHGGTYGLCNECNWNWPCPTFVWATTERDFMATWNPEN